MICSGMNFSIYKKLSLKIRISISYSSLKFLLFSKICRNFSQIFQLFHCSIGTTGSFF